MAIRLSRRIWAQAGPGGAAADAGLHAPHDFAPAGRGRDPSGSAVVHPDATVCYEKHCVLGFNSQQSQEEEADISKAFSQRLPNAGSNKRTAARPMKGPKKQLTFDPCEPFLVPVKLSA